MCDESEVFHLEVGVFLVYGDRDGCIAGRKNAFEDLDGFTWDDDFLLFGGCGFGYGEDDESSDIGRDDSYAFFGVAFEEDACEWSELDVVFFAEGGVECAFQGEAQDGSGDCIEGVRGWCG